MTILQEEYASPLDPTRVFLKVYEQPDGAYLVTEERQGTTTVIATLGAFDSREAAIALARRRGAQLEERRYTRVRPAA
jgi:hypothetical protein